MTALATLPEADQRIHGLRYVPSTDDGLQLLGEIRGPLRGLLKPGSIRPNGFARAWRRGTLRIERLVQLRQNDERFDVKRNQIGIRSPLGENQSQSAEMAFERLLDEGSVLNGVALPLGDELVVNGRLSDPGKRHGKRPSEEK